MYKFIAIVEYGQAKKTTALNGLFYQFQNKILISLIMINFCDKRHRNQNMKEKECWNDLKPRLIINPKFC